MIGEFFSFLDSGLALLLPWVAARIAFWAALSGAASMGLYALVSPQRRMKEIKQEAKAVRESLSAHEGDFASAWPMIRRNLALSFQNVGLALGPSLVAGLPVVLVLFWMAGAYSHRLPEPGEEVSVAVEPPSTAALPERVPWPGEGDPVMLRDAGGRELLRLPAEAPSPVIEKRDWTHFFYAIPAGYLPDDTDVRTLSLGYPEVEALPFGAGWVRSWWFLFLVVTTAAALVVKIGFKIS